MKDYGKPVGISREELGFLSDDLRDGLKDEIKDILENLPKPEQLVSDHVHEASKDCVITFLDEGLIPTVRDRSTLPTTAEILEIARDFMNDFSEKHPNDFDITDPEDIIFDAQLKIFDLILLYGVKSESDRRFIPTFKLISKTSDLLDKAVQELIPDDEP